MLGEENNTRQCEPPNQHDVPDSEANDLSKDKIGAYKPIGMRILGDPRLCAVG